MIEIDGRPVEARGTLLDACRSAGADVPALCADATQGARGHCRACLVEMDGRTVAACTTPALTGAVVRTDGPALRAYRRDLGELMLSECRPAGLAARSIARWGADGTRYGLAPATGRLDHSHAFLRFEGDRCILCRRCLAACEEIEGRFVFAIENRGADTRLGWGGVPLAGTSCTSCGACVEACPSEALLAVRPAATDRGQGVP
jgi:formate dehydrogenase major subunit